MEQFQKTIKDNIRKLIDSGNLQEANLLISQYKSIEPNDIEVYSIQAVVAILESRLSDAKNVLLQALNIDKNNFDLLYNLAYVYEALEENQEAYTIYLKLSRSGNIGGYNTLVLEAIQRLQKLAVNDHKEVDSKKIVFFVKQGMDSFLSDIINALSKEYKVKKVIVTHTNQIDEGMQWADICWFEWCDELVVYGSKQQWAKNKKVICRLHSYEAFTEYPLQVNWEVVDSVIFVAQHISNIILEKVNSLNTEKIFIIPNGIDQKKYAFRERQSGFNIAYVGYINYKKGPMLLLHTFKAIYDYDDRYKLYMAGTFQDERDLLYYQQMINEMELKNNVFYQGWQEDLDEWLEDKNYILCTSILESQNMSVMQAMAKGIKPLIHNFVGAKGIYLPQYIWNTIDQCVGLLNEKNYNSKEYNEFVSENYSLNKQIFLTKELVTRIK